MNFTLSELLIWLIVGGLVGSLVGMIVTRRKEGFGHWINLGIGMIGAVIGGIIFNLFKIDLGLGEFAITAEDLISALMGAILFVVFLWIFKKVRANKKAKMKNA